MYTKRIVLSIIGFVFLCTLFLGLARPAYAYIARISATSGTSVNPIRVHKRFSHWLDITNVDPYQQTVYGLKFELIPQTNTGLKLLGVKFVRVSDGTVLCTATPCEAGDLAFGNTVRAIATYQAQKIGTYDELWYVWHDGWLTPNGSALIVVKK